MRIDLYTVIAAWLVFGFWLLLINLLLSRWHIRRHLATVRRQRAEERHFNGWDRKGDVA